MNSVFHNSSDRVNAYSALQVRPIRSKLDASKYSNSVKITSSGRALKAPIAARRSRDAVRALPLGFTPRGWQGISSLDSKGLCTLPLLL